MSIARSSSASTLAPNGSVPGSSRTPEARGPRRRGRSRGRRRGETLVLAVAVAAVGGGVAPEVAEAECARPPESTAARPSPSPVTTPSWPSCNWVTRQLLYTRLYG